MRQTYLVHLERVEIVVYDEHHRSAASHKGLAFGVTPLS
jgi:hypothetical protein